jgi:hypothetical protein
MLKRLSLEPRPPPPADRGEPRAIDHPHATPLAPVSNPPVPPARNVRSGGGSWLGALAGRFKPATLGVLAGALLLSGGASVAGASPRIDPPPAYRSSVRFHHQHLFDPAEQLARFGVTPLRLGPDGFDPKQALTTSADGKTLHFAFPNGSEASAPTKIQIVEYTDWNPSGSATHLTVADPNVMHWLESHEVGSADNFEHTDFDALTRWVEHWVRDHRREVKALGIDDVHRLTPKQASNLAGLLTARTMHYDDTAVRFGGSMFHPQMKAALARLRTIDPEIALRIEASLPTDVPAHVREMDEIGLDRLLEVKRSRDNPRAETGVCRNSTEMFQGMFEVLKRLQTSGASRLDNTYVKMPSGEDHIWIALYTVEADRTLTMTQLEPTWPAPDTKAEAIAGALDRPVAERALFAVCHMQLAMNGTNRLPTDENFDLLELVALDLAARGRADEGARLLVQYTRDLPDALRHNWIYLLNEGPGRARDESAWHFPGERALFDAIAPLLPSLQPE